MGLLDKLSSVAKPKIELTVSNKTVVRVLAWVFGAILFYKFFNKIGHSLTLIGGAAFLALALNPAVSWLTHKLPSKSRVRGTAAAYLVVIIVLGSFAALVVPPLINQTTDFIKDAPQTLRDVKTQDSAIGRTIRKYGLDKQIDKLSNDISSKVSDFTGPVFSTAGKIASTITSIITVLVLTFMMLVEGPKWFEMMWKLHPNGELENRRKKMAAKMYRIITSYVNGQVLIAAIAAMFAAIVLFITSSIFNASVNAIALAGIVFLFGLIPLVGNLLSAAIVVLVCALSSLPLAVVMLAYFLVYQQVENVTLQPYIQAKNNELTPLLVFVAALLGAGLGGILGAFVAIPAMGCLKIAIEDYLEHNPRSFID